MNLIIDGKPAAAQSGQTVLECALAHDISIPHLCTHPNLPPFGACRMCIVEIDGLRGYPASCSTPAAEGMVVRTDTPALRELRRKILELILLEHPSACLVCDKKDLCEKYRPAAAKAGRTTGCHTCNNKEVCEVRVLSDQLGVRSLPVPPTYRDLPLERSDPFMDRDLNLCILCGRCVRICKEQHGWATIDFVGRGSRTRIGEAFGRSLLEAGCRFCGSCVDVCPTGSLADRYAKWHGALAALTETTCLFCEARCAIKIGTTERRRAVTARAVNGAVPICVLGRFAIPEYLNGVARLTAPQARVGNVLRQVQWDEALRMAGERLKPFVGDGFALVCDAASTLEDRRVFKRFAREVMKSPHCIEIEPDERGASRAALPTGTRAALLTGDFVDAAQLQGLQLLIVQDAYPSEAGESAHFVFPAAVFAEVEGTCLDAAGRCRPLRQACAAPGQAKPDWRIVADLAKAMGAGGFSYESAAAIAKEMDLPSAELWIERGEAPAPAGDPQLRRTHFRGRRIDSLVRGLRALPVSGSAAVAAGVGG